MPPVVGYIDFIEIRRDDDGIERLHLVDYKTAGKTPASAEDIGTDQLILYAIAARQTGLADALGLPIALRFDVITKTKNPTFVSLSVSIDTRAEERLTAKIRELWRGMQARICYPNPSWSCKGCGYAHHCEEWPNGTFSPLAEEE